MNISLNAVRQGSNQKQKNKGKSIMHDKDDEILSQDQFKSEMFKIERKKNIETYSVSNLVKQQKLNQKQKSYKKDTYLGLNIVSGQHKREQSKETLNFKLDRREREALNDFLSDEDDLNDFTNKFSHQIKTPITHQSKLLQSKQQEKQRQIIVLANSQQKLKEDQKTDLQTISRPQTRRRPHTASKSSTAIQTQQDFKNKTGDNFNKLSTQVIQQLNAEEQMNTQQLSNQEQFLIPISRKLTQLSNKPPLNSQSKTNGGHASKSINASYSGGNSPSNSVMRNKILRESKAELCKKLNEVENKISDSRESSLLKNKFCKIYAKISTMNMTQDGKLVKHTIHNNDFIEDQPNLQDNDNNRNKKEIYMNLSAKINNKNLDNLLSSMESKFKRIMNKSNSKDVVNRMIEVIDSKHKLQETGTLTNLKSDNTFKQLDLTQIIKDLDKSAIMQTQRIQDDAIKSQQNQLPTISLRRNKLEEFRLRDNLDIDNFFKLTFDQRFQIKINSEDLNFAKEKITSNFVKANDQSQQFTLNEEILPSTRQEDIIMGVKRFQKSGFWIKKQALGTCPVSKENPTLFYIQNQRQLYVSGGYSNCSQLEVNEIVLSGNQSKWRKSIPKQHVQNHYGQVMHIYEEKYTKQKKIIMFGGQASLEKQQGKAKYSCSELKILDLDNLEMNEFSPTGDLIQGRKNMGSCIIDGKMFIHGGQDNQQDALGDFFVFDAQTFVWKKLKVTPKNSGKYTESINLKLSHHTMTALHKPLQGIIEIYIFGGLDHEHKPQNKLYQLQYNIHSQETFIKSMSDQKGISPSPRSHHTALLIHRNKYLLIYGGKNEDNYQSNSQNLSSNSIAINDIVLYNLNTKCWENFDQFGFKPEPRWNTSIVYDELQDKLILFGGSNLQGFCTNHLYILEMKQDTIDILCQRVNQCQIYLQDLEKRILKPNENSGQSNLNSINKSVQMKQSNALLSAHKRAVKFLDNRSANKIRQQNDDFDQFQHQTDESNFNNTPIRRQFNADIQNDDNQRQSLTQQFRLESQTSFQKSKSRTKINQNMMETLNLYAKTITKPIFELD
eukprot:403362402